MTKKDYVMIAEAINRAKRKKIPAKLMFYQIPMEIAGEIAKKDKSFDYRAFFAVCNR